MQKESSGAETTARFALMLLPIMVAVLSGFLIIGIALSVLPRHVHDDLKFGTFFVGLVTSAQFVASMITRLYAGRFVDIRGGKRAIITGLLLTSVGGAFYLASLAFVENRVISITLILVGRAVVGGAESFIITGAITLALNLAGPKLSGRVIAWIGTAMFGAFALGAPIGTTVYSAYGFFWIAIVTVVLPLVSTIATRKLPNGNGAASVKGSFKRTVSAAWLPGLGAACNGVGFSALLSFSVLLFTQRGWGLAWLPVTAFAVSLVTTRLLYGQRVDQIGGIRVGIMFSFVTAAGQLLMWIALSPWVAALAAGLTGAGWAMVYPAFGSEVVRRTGANNKGIAMALYSVFPDFAIGLSSPLLGLAVSGGKVDSAFFWSTIVALIGVPVALASRRSITATAIEH